MNMGIVLILIRFLLERVMTDPRLWDAHIHVETKKTTPQAVLELARSKGLTVGLVDHVFKNKDRITCDQIKTACRKKYPDVNFIFGCEADVYEVGKVALTETQRIKVDFIIASFTHTTQPDMLDKINNSDEIEIGIFLLELLKTAVEYPYTNVIAHPFSFPPHKADIWKAINTIPQEELRKQLRKAKDKGIAVEINARTLKNNDARPQEYFINLANQEGCIFTVGSDAHSIEEVGLTGNAWSLIDRLKIKYEKIIFPHCFIR